MFATLILAGSFFGPQLPADAPILRREKNLTCADWANVANHYIAVGEAKAVEELLDRMGKNPTRYMISTEHAARICRLLYVPKPGKKLRRPLSGPWKLPDGSESIDRWPDFPFALQDDVWFLLTDGSLGYGSTGAPESVSHYIRYCQTDGVFRSRPHILPTSTQAKKALEALLKSDRWDPWYGQKWKSSSRVDGLRRQAEF